MVDGHPNTTKVALRRYFDVAHEVVLWKLAGLSEYDLRRPLTPTGTNLLGLAKHLALVELEYFGIVFDRPHGLDVPTTDEDNADMFATADESSDDIIALFRSAWAHAQSTIDSLDLDAPGHVPWWADANPVTLVRILIHMTAELHRHAGHIDILREMIDGASGWSDGNDNMPPLDSATWSAHCERLEQIAVAADSS